MFKYKNKDASVLAEFLVSRNPFTADDFINIVTGESASINVNVDRAKEIGEQILSGMSGKQISEYSSKKKDQAVTFASKEAVRIGKVWEQMLAQKKFFHTNYAHTRQLYLRKVIFCLPQTSHSLAKRWKN